MRLGGQEGPPKGGDLGAKQMPGGRAHLATFSLTRASFCVGT